MKKSKLFSAHGKKEITKLLFRAVNPGDVFKSGMCLPSFNSIGGIVSFPLTPISSYFSRRHEREADRFAAEMTENREAMAISLIKLSKDNLSNLHPHPLYASFYYSHPPVVQRIREIRSFFLL